MNAGLETLRPEYLAVVAMAPQDVSIMRTPAGNYQIKRHTTLEGGGYEEATRYVSTWFDSPEVWLKAIASVMSGVKR